MNPSLSRIARAVSLYFLPVIAAWACTLAGYGRHARAFSQQEHVKTTSMIVKSVKPETPASAGIVAYGLTRNDYRRIVSQIPDLRRMVPVRETAGRARYGDRLLDVQLIGTTEAFAARHAVKVVRGRFLSQQDLKRRQNLAVIDRELAESLFLDENPIGKSIRIEQSYFLVAGVVSRDRGLQSTKGSARLGDADLQVFIPLSTMWARMGDTEIIRRSGSIDAAQYELSRIEITVEDPAKAGSTAAAIERILQAFHEQPDYSVEVVR